MPAWRKKRKQLFLENLNLKRDNYVLVTIHRDTNTDDVLQARRIFLSHLNRSLKKNNINLVMPFHPRTVISLKN